MSPKLCEKAGRSRANRYLPRLETLEARCLPDVGPGIYVEDFTNNGDLNDPNDDVPAFTVPPDAFQHSLVNNGQTHFITDPGDVLGSHYQITQLGTNDTLLLFEGQDQITFNLEPGLHVALASIDVRAVRQARVEFVGRNGTAGFNFNPEVPVENFGVGQGHILPSGDPLGPIQQINLIGHAFFDNVDILVIESQGPQVLDDFVGTPPRRPRRVDVLENDSDADGQNLRIVSFTQPTNGSVQKIRLTPPGRGSARDAFRYTPRGDYHGRDSFTYTAADPDGNRSTATVSISVNSPPTAAPIDIRLAHGTPGPFTGLIDVNDAEGDAVSGFEILTAPEFGSAAIDPATGMFSYQPAPVDYYDNRVGRTHFNVHKIRGDDQFTYRFTDGFDVGEGSVVIRAQNLPPSAANDRFFLPANPAGEQPEVTQWAAPGVLWNDGAYPMFRDPAAIDVEGDQLSAVLVTPPEHGFLVLNPDGSFSYSPVPGYIGPDYFQYRASDGYELSPVADVTLLVEEPSISNPIPLARPDSYEFPFAAIPDYRLQPNPLDNDARPDHLGDLSPRTVRGGHFARFVRFAIPDEIPELELDLEESGLAGVRTLVYAYRRESDQSYSNFATVTMDVMSPDTDGDGASDAEEGWGWPPSQRSDIAAVLPIASEHKVYLMSGPSTIAGTFGPPLRNVAAVPNPHPADSPPGVVFPLGFVRFDVVTTDTGGIATVTLLVPQNVFGINSYFKYGPEPQNPATPEDETQPHWYNFTYDPVTQTGAQFENDGVNDLIVLHFRDGLRGDDDLISNGVVVDPGAPAHIPGPPAAAVQINDGSPQRSRINRLILTFDDAVTFDAGAIRLMRSGTRVKLKVVTEIVSDHTVATLTFPRNHALRPLQGGNYTLIIRGLRVESQFGFRLDGDGDGQEGGNARVQFRSRFGDANGDGKLDTIDRDLFLAALGSSEGDPEYLWYFDRNGDGIIDNKDSTRALRRLIRNP
jgi:hypothetical protein